MLATTTHINTRSLPKRRKLTTASKPPRLLPNPNIRVSIHVETHSSHTNQSELSKGAQSTRPRTIIHNVPLPLGLNKSRLQDYISSISATSNGDIFLPQYSEILPSRLFISDYFTGTEAETLKQLRITHVASIVHVPPPPGPSIYPPRLPGITYHEAVVPKEAYREDNLIGIIADTVDFVERAFRRWDGRVLIYCQTGVDWSASFAIACIMRDRSCEYEEARKIVKRKREVIALGADLERGVREWEGMESARTYFPIGRGSRLDPLMKSPLWDAPDSTPGCQSRPSEEGERTSCKSAKFKTWYHQVTNLRCH